MKNESLFPFKRNNYFFGKLMTEHEYNTEQAYFNNKRRLLNLAMYGHGVVFGLTVIKYDGVTLVVDSGLAIDGLGRELCVAEPVIKRLSALDGFTDDSGELDHVYLCAEYNETQEDPVYAITGGTNNAQYSRVNETVRLYLSYSEPEPHEIGLISGRAARAENMEDKLERGAQTVLYLARIHLVRWKDAYDIDEIDIVPFNQYAACVNAPEPQNQGVSGDSGAGNHTSAGTDAKTPPATACGTAEVKILEDARPGSVYYSEDIAHGLGLVPAAVTLGLLHVDGTVFGDPMVFGAETGFTYAACVSTREGSFRIGVLVKSKVSEQTVRFTWLAAYDPLRTAAENALPAVRIAVKPGLPRVKPFEILRFTAERTGEQDADLVWSVAEPNGGEITKEGVYVAPADAGVYTVTARWGRVSAQAFVVVS